MRQLTFMCHGKIMHTLQYIETHCNILKHTAPHLLYIFNNWRFDLFKTLQNTQQHSLNTRQLTVS